MDDNILQDLIESVKRQNLHVLSVVVRKDGDIIAEHHFKTPKPTLLWSVSKTFTSMAIGIAESEGYFSLGDKVVEHFASDIEGAIEGNDNLSKMTIHDLLCMGTGHARCPMDEVIKNNGPFDNISKLFFEEPVVYEAGKHFVYNNGATYMLSKLITVTTGYNLKEYLMPRIFRPLEIAEPYWEADINDISFGCNGLYLTALDLSKAGQLLLNKGRWNEKQIIPEAYIAKATKVQIDTAHLNDYYITADHKQGYGYQIWMNSYPNSYRMDGLFGQYVVMLPEKNAVVTYVSNEPSNMTGVLELTWNTLVDKL
ncbi:serine hydrolase domain-containing protein [Clostridium cellulovorans]|uniref:Beta-lactamase n=1 Tax=Clostridium cellulovorans (strain ATCC 35296 / DSM 3052 / OCM 3 / 743B) TaxID=573061 RepID=D9SLG7_CLOC7|nr:serine hydrolase [Clostridium cellulovorans]ADL53604.1 beta-lactamase [Clostridium cellulovorans 743B]